MRMRAVKDKHEVKLFRKVLLHKGLERKWKTIQESMVVNVMVAWIRIVVVKVRVVEFYIYFGGKASRT